MEMQLVFGAKTSPAIYDHLHKVFLPVTRLQSRVNSAYLHLTLNDFLMVTPDRKTNKRIVLAYLKLAR